MSKRSQESRGGDSGGDLAILFLAIVCLGMIAFSAAGGDSPGGNKQVAGQFSILAMLGAGGFILLVLVMIFMHHDRRDEREKNQKTIEAMSRLAEKAMRYNAHVANSAITASAKRALPSTSRSRTKNGLKPGQVLIREVLDVEATPEAIEKARSRGYKLGEVEGAKALINPTTGVAYRLIEIKSKPIAPRNPVAEPVRRIAAPAPAPAPSRRTTVPTPSGDYSPERMERIHEEVGKFRADYAERKQFREYRERVAYNRRMNLRPLHLKPGGGPEEEVVVDADFRVLPD